MPLVPLFRQDELLAAFRLVLPPAEAESVTAEWWRLFADEVDPQGYFLYEDFQAQLPKGPQVMATGRPLTEAQQLESERVVWGSMSLKDRKELLLRFSSFHFGLLGLVSDELRERVRVIQGWTPEQIARNQAQMKRIVAAMSHP